MTNYISDLISAAIPCGSNTIETYLAADKLAARAHKGQKRKWTDEDYIVHPRKVASYVFDETSNLALASVAVLHDVVEDTDVTIEEIEAQFGCWITEQVAAVTKISKKEDGNRAVRKAMDQAHYALGSAYAQTVKLADIIANSEGLTTFVPRDFALKYIPEQIALANALTKGHKYLQWEALDILETAWAELTKA